MNSVSMKLYPSFLYGCSTVALWRTVAAFSPPTSLHGAVSKPSSPAWQQQRRRSFSTTMALRESKIDQSFKTWSFDKPCNTMAWNQVVDVPMSLATASDASQIQNDADLVLIGVYAPAKQEEDNDDEEEEGEDKEPAVVTLTGLAEAMDKELGGALSEVMAENAKEFKNGAQAGSATPTVRLVTSDGKTRRYILVGLGSAPKENDDDQKKAAANIGAGFAIGKTIASKCNDEKKVTACSVVLPEQFGAASQTICDLSTAFYQTLYSDNRFRTKSNIKKVVEDLKSVSLYSEVRDAASASGALDQGRKIATGVFLAKDIVNSPHNVLNSESLADTARRIAEKSGGRLKCKILDKNECEKRGMGAYLGVARGSETQPQFIHLTYTPAAGKAAKRVGVVGKGLLFDTGGYNIKTQMMELMKFDCGGSAAVLGAARAIGELAPPNVEAHFIVAACENMIGSKAVVPSDILTASNGKTIEVLNTDAEGRLTLADALVYADKELDCESIIELSTLTGACMISLGKEIAGLWTDNDDLAKELEEISKATGDKSWRMPLAKEYNKQLESKVADLKNLGGPGGYGGAITAALFLQNFVSKNKPFAHIDIAGPVWSDEIGATGMGAKLVTEWVRRQGQAKE